jgi:hypothetical protein
MPRSSRVIVNKKPTVVSRASQSFKKRTSKTAKKRTETKLDKEIKIILVISGHGYCETIKCKENICKLTDEEQPACIFDKDKSILHDCGDATSNFHMSAYTKDIKLYSYAQYGHRNWSNTFKLFTDRESNDLYYNDFSRIYNVNREIEATLEALKEIRKITGNNEYNNYNDLMKIVSREINDPKYIGTYKQFNKACLDLEESVMINFNKKSIVKEVYNFDDDYRSDDPLFTQLKKPIEEPGWASWFWSVLGYHKYLSAPETPIAPNVIFSGIFVAQTNQPKNFGEAENLLPNESNPNYNCDFTLFSHIFMIGGQELCNLIFNYIIYWNKYITENSDFELCEKRINKIVLKYIKAEPLLSKITYINNESLYHIVNIILNFNIPGSELIETLSDSFDELEKLSGDDYIRRFKVLLDDICGLFNVELHLISNACRSLLESVMPEPYMESKIQTLQENIHSCMKPLAGGKTTRKRKHRRTKKRRRVHKKYI